MHTYTEGHAHTHAHTQRGMYTHTEASTYTHTQRYAHAQRHCTCTHIHTYRGMHIHIMTHACTAMEVPRRHTGEPCSFPQHRSTLYTLLLVLLYNFFSVHETTERRKTGNDMRTRKREEVA